MYSFRIVATLFLIEYVGFTDWLPTWRRSNFITSQGTPVKNVKLIMYMDALFAVRERSGQDVRLKHVRGHAGEVGNEGADALAVHGVKLPEIDEPDWDALRLQLERKPVSVESADASVSRLRILRLHGTPLKMFVSRCTPKWCLMKVVFLQSSTQRRLGTVFIIIIDSWPNTAH
jgi:RNase H